MASDHDEGLACQLALVALSEATGCTLRVAQRLLDGPFGAGLGGKVVGLMSKSEMALDAAIAEAVRSQPKLQQVEGEMEKALPSGVAESFDRVADYGFVQAIWPVVGQVEIVVLCLTAAVIIGEEADVSGDAVNAFLRHPETGYAFGATIVSHLMLDPERRVERAMQAAIKDWKKLSLPPAVAARFAAKSGEPRLVALARWHETERAVEE